MDVDIIIPVYNSKKTLKRTLFSIAYQKGCEHFHVYLVNDCGIETYEAEINLFKDNLDIKELMLNSNGGPGVARQKGIDNSNSKYIVFIDSDDYFYTPDAICKMYDNIISEDYDLLISNFIYERDGESSIKKRSPIWLHGKMYKRDFLKRNDIKFNSTRANEDNGFNRLIILSGANIGYLDQVTYVYSENSFSITRKENREYKFLGLEGYAYNMVWAMDNALKRGGEIELISNFALQVLVSFYFYYLELYEFYDVERIFSWCIKVKSFYLKYHDLEKDKELIGNLITQYREVEYKEKNINFIIDFYEFFSKIGDVCND